MKYKKLVYNLLFLPSLFLMGIILSESTGRLLGLGKPLLYRKDPLVGYRLQPNQNNRRRNNAMVTTDYEGFRVNTNVKKDSFKEIVVFVGDSITYGGSYVDNSELFASLYCEGEEELLCLNGGLNAWGIGNMGKFISNFSLYSERIPSKFIVVILPGDDTRNQQIFRGLPYWTAPPKHPRATNEVLKHLLSTHILPGLSSKRTSITADPKIVKTQKDLAWKDFSNNIKSAGSTTEVFITPPRQWLDDPIKFSDDIKTYDEYLNMLSTIPNVQKTCNLYYSLRNDYSPSDYVDDVHLSAEGQKKWAKNLKSCKG